MESENTTTPLILTPTKKDFDKVTELLDIYYNKTHDAKLKQQNPWH